MDDHGVRNSVKQGTIHPFYILLGSEPLIMDKTIETIEQHLHIDRSFDYDVFSMSETPVQDVLSKIYSTPFASPKRLIIARNIEELDQQSLTDLAREISHTRTSNCLVMKYTLSKGDKKIKATEKKLQELFPDARIVTYRADKGLVRNWINAKVRRDKLPLSAAMMRYLEEEFSNDITGLKNEFDKIENYLADASSITNERIQDLAQGLCDFNIFEMIDGFIKGRTNVISVFKELQPYLRTHTEILGVLTWRIIYHAQHAYSILRTGTTLHRILDDLADLDIGIKGGSQFSNIKFELFFLKNARIFRKGAIYG